MPIADDQTGPSRTAEGLLFPCSNGGRSRKYGFAFSHILAIRNLKKQADGAFCLPLAAALDLTLVRSVENGKRSFEYHTFPYAF